MRLLSLSLYSSNGQSAQIIGHTLVMHIARLELRRSTVSALPKWRLKRVLQYVDAQLEETLSLADTAAAAGLSRMHFAAQFRAATGFRPHDYLLNQRVESAKELLSKADTSLAEIALTVASSLKRTSLPSSGASRGKRLRVSVGATLIGEANGEVASGCLGRISPICLTTKGCIPLA